MKNKKNVGLGITSPDSTGSTDKKSPFSGNIRLHGRNFIGTVISAKMQKTATIEWERKVKVQKYERYMKKRSRIKAHNPDEIKAKEGDVVRIIETRPISKTNNFVIVEKIGKEKGFTQRMEAIEASKKKVREEMEEKQE